MATFAIVDVDGKDHSTSFAERPIQACLFDMDGLLLDTESVYTRVTQEIVSRFGKNYEWSLKSRMMGMRAMEAAELLVKELEIPMAPADYLDERNRKQAELFPFCSLLPGVDKLIRHLHAKKIPIAVATSSHRDAFNIKVQNHKEFFGLFDAIVTGNDPAIKRGKPEPDIFIHALSLLGPFDPSRVLVFEDAPVGVAAARAAGMHALWVPDPNLRDRDAVHASQILDSLEQFRPEQWGLPAYE